MLTHSYTEGSSRSLSVDYSTEEYFIIEMLAQVMVQSYYITCPDPDCEEPLAIDEARFDDGILDVEFECPGCGMSDNLRHENPER